MAFRRKKCCEISQHFFLVRWLLTMLFDILCGDGVFVNDNEALDDVAKLADSATPVSLGE